jgi:hypothetical protein
LVKDDEGVANGDGREAEGRGGPVDVVPDSRWLRVSFMAIELGQRQSRRRSTA